MSQLRWAHKGWFLFCPIRLAGLETEAPVVEPRWGWANVLFDLSLWVFTVQVRVLLFFNPERELHFPLRLTGRLEDGDG